MAVTLHWRHNDHDGVSNHQPHCYLLNRLFGRRSKKTSKLRVTGLCVGNSPGPVNSPHKGPVTRKMVPFDDVIMIWSFCKRDFLCIVLKENFSTLFWKLLLEFVSQSPVDNRLALVPVMARNITHVFVWTNDDICISKWGSLFLTTYWRVFWFFLQNLILQDKYRCHEKHIKLRYSILSLIRLCF